MNQIVLRNNMGHLIQTNFSLRHRMCNWFMLLGIPIHFFCFVHALKIFLLRMISFNKRSVNIHLLLVKLTE